MSTALATVSLVEKAAPGGKHDVTLEVWSRSYDHPDPKKRSSVVSKVMLVGLPQMPGYTLTLGSITDRYGIDHASLWINTSGALTAGFDAYQVEVPCTGGPLIVKGVIFTGIYDERCLADPACDAMRFQTIAEQSQQAFIYSYLPGPLTFKFSINAWGPNVGVEITRTLVGGNGGNKATRFPTTPPEVFTVHLP